MKLFDPCDEWIARSEIARQVGKMILGHPPIETFTTKWPPSSTTASRSPLNTELCWEVWGASKVQIHF